jgi:hypothetical protein
MTKGNPEIYTDHFLVRPEESCLKGTVKFIGYGTIFGTSIAMITAQNYENVSFLETAGRSVARYIFPLALVGGMYASTTCMMDEVRGRHRPVSNGFIGGAVAGAVLGTKTHNLGKVASYAFLFGMAGGFARLCAVGMFVRYNPKGDLEDLNKTIVMSELRHLASPTK